MGYPTPTSPTINDLWYNALNPGDARGGSLNTTAFVLSYFVSVSETVRPSENVVLNLPGFSYLVDTSDFLGTAENVNITPDPNQNNQFSIVVSDATVTAENRIVTAPFSPASTDNVVVNETVVTADPAVVVEA